MIATCTSLLTDVPVARLGRTVPDRAVLTPTTTLLGGTTTARLRVAGDGQRYQAPPMDAGACA